MADFGWGKQIILRGVPELTEARGPWYFARQIVARGMGFLNQQVLVPNRLWQAVNVCSVKRALTLVFQGQAQVVASELDGSFQTFNFNQWQDLSEQQPHPESIHTISFKIRIPKVILLMVFDRLPKKELKFT